LANHEVKEEFSESGQKHKEVRPLREVSIARVILQAWWEMANNYCFLLHSNHVAITFIVCSLLHLSCSSPVTASLVTMVTLTQLFLSRTIENVMQYSICQKESYGFERQDWKNFNSGGFKLLKEGHVKKAYLQIMLMSKQVAYLK